MSGIKEIAKRAHVSVASVSAALSGTGRIGAEKREMIRKIAAELGYKQNAAAALLKQKLCRDIGLIASSPGQREGSANFTLPMIMRLTHACSQEGIRCQFEFHAASDEQRIPDLLTNGLAGGFLHTGFLSNALQKYLQEHPEIPFVSLEERSGYSVTSDYEDAVYHAVERLVRNGRKRIMLLYGPPEFLIHKNTYNGFIHGIKEYGLDTQNGKWISSFIKLNDTDAVAYGIELAGKILKMRKKPEALICGDGRILTGIAGSLLAKGISIPEDLNLILPSFSSREAERTYLPFTSIEMNADEVFKQAYGLLNGLMHGQKTEQKNISVPAIMKERKTTNFIK